VQAQSYVIIGTQVNRHDLTCTQGANGTFKDLRPCWIKYQSRHRVTSRLNNLNCSSIFGFSILLHFFFNFVSLIFFLISFFILPFFVLCPFSVPHLFLSCLCVLSLFCICPLFLLFSSYFCALSPVFDLSLWCRFKRVLIALARP
jgi:hypothetical protein